MAFGITHIRKKLCVHQFLPLNDAEVDVLQLYYMGRTAEQFAESPEPNGVQRKLAYELYVIFQLTAAQT